MKQKITILCKDGGYKNVEVGLTEAIKINCTECQGWETNPEECININCALFPWRGYTQKGFHSIEKEKKVRTPEQIEAFKIVAKKYKERKNEGK